MGRGNKLTFEKMRPNLEKKPAEIKKFIHSFPPSLHNLYSLFSPIFTITLSLPSPLTSISNPRVDQIL